MSQAVSINFPKNKTNVGNSELLFITVYIIIFIGIFLESNERERKSSLLGLLVHYPNAWNKQARCLAHNMVTPMRCQDTRIVLWPASCRMHISRKPCQRQGIRDSTHTLWFVVPVGDSASVPNAYQGSSIY